MRAHSRVVMEVMVSGWAISFRQASQGQRRACASSRTDRAEQVRALVALISGLARARSAFCPLPHEAILLADPRLVLEPDLDGFSRCDAGQMDPQRGREVFLNASIVRPSCAG